MELLQHFVGDLEWLATKDFDHLSVTPLLWNKAPLDTKNYLSLDQALAKGFAEVEEVSQSGTVGRVLVKNFSDQYLVMFDGDGLKGAKQNRILEQTIIAAPGSVTEVPVNCVERGRWNYNSEKFSGADFKATPMVKQAKASLKKEGRDRSVQSSVWQNVSMCSRDLGVSSYSDDLGDIIERSGISANDVVSWLEGVEAHGYLIQGAGAPFFEIFPDKGMAKTWAEKSAIGWLADSRRARARQRPVEELIQRLKTSTWRQARHVGDESAYQSSDWNDGRLTFHDRQMMHLYCSIADRRS